jgi:hypothetical protein
MMYFKTAVIDFDKIDPQQISNIKVFKEDISNRGVLFSNFNHISEFQILIRRHLTTLLNEISNNIEDIIRETPEENSIIVLEKTNPLDEELGYFEYFELGNLEITKMQFEIEKLGKEITDLGNRMAKKAERLNVINKSSGAGKQRQTKLLIDKSAEDLNIFNKNIEPIPIAISQLFKASMNSYNKAFLIHRDYIKNEEEKEKMIGVLTTLKQAMATGNDSLLEMKEAIKSLPPMTTNFRKSKEKATGLMANITDELSSYINIIDKIISTSF